MNETTNSRMDDAGDAFIREKFMDGFQVRLWCLFSIFLTRFSSVNCEPDPKDFFREKWPYQARRVLQGRLGKQKDQVQELGLFVLLVPPRRFELRSWP